MLRFREGLLFQTLMLLLLLLIINVPAHAAGKVSPSNAQTIHLLIVRLGDPSRKVKDAASDALAKIGKPAVLPLCRALKARQNSEMVARALMVIKDPRAIPALMGVLGQGPESGYYIVSRALGAIGAPAVRPLIRALRSPDASVRVEATMALGMTNDPRAIRPLIRMFNEQRRWNDPQASFALANIGKPAVPSLLRCLMSRNHAKRDGAMETLAELGEHRATRPLINLLSSHDVWERLSVANALGRIGDHRAILPLRKHRNDPDEGVRTAIREALSRLTDD